MMKLLYFSRYHENKHKVSTQYYINIFNWKLYKIIIQCFVITLNQKSKH